ncbi:MAG TPA: glucose-6-phosphate isomerase [Mycobacteriales bacterium]|nr:glucose-6-phosphate isomerase [Mycobacteriales bacterium]
MSELSLRAPDTGALQHTIERLVSDQVASGITAQNPTLWGPEAESEASIRLSWVGLAESSRPLLAEISALREELAADGIDHVVLAGMGGSSLAPEVITATAGVSLVTLDTTDAGQVAAALGEKLERTVLVVSSKSGGTVETDSHRRVYEKAFTDAGIDAASRIVVVTDPGSPFEKVGREAGYRKVFLADPNVGGRYSALTAFGLVPAGLAGADIAGLLDEAAAAATELTADTDGNPGLRLGALLGLAHDAGTEKVVLADTGSGITGFGDWVEQLIAESTGKDGKGLLPVVVEDVRAPGFADAGKDAILVSLGPDAGVDPASGFAAAISYPLGGAMLVWEYAIAVAGRLIGINPFDQPNVEEAKAQARSLLDRSDTGEPAKPAFVEGAVEVYGDDSILNGAHTLAEVLAGLNRLAPAAGYLSVQAYLNRWADASAADLRAGIARSSGLQTTFGWGPRFLHSTGQYHKGGHPNGGFVQITGAVADDLSIPDRPYSFAVLQAAQAAGDAAVIESKGRPVLHLHLTDRTAGLGQLLEAIS